MFSHKMFFDTYCARIIEVARQAALDELNFSAEEFNLHMQQVRDTINKELSELLPQTINLDFFKKYMQFSGRFYLHINQKKKTIKLKGNKQLDSFIEEIIENTAADDSTSISLRNYIKQTKKINNENIPDDVVRNDKIIKEIIHFVAKQVVLTLCDQLRKSKTNKKNHNVRLSVNSTARTDSLQFSQLFHQINLMCELYIKNQFARLQELKTLLADSDQLVEHEDNKIPQLTLDSSIKLPAKITLVQKNDSQSDDNQRLIENKLNTVTQQYNKMQELRSVLHTKDTERVQKFQAFRNEYFKSEELLNKDIDNTLKKVLNAIKNLLLSGLRGTLMFWKSEATLVKDMLMSCNDETMKKVNTVTITTKTESNHRRHSNRSRV